jgi:hypothetical protein
MVMGNGRIRWPHTKGFTMRNLKRTAAVVGASAVIAALGTGGVVAAQANSSPAPHGQVKQATSEEGAETDDGPDVGPDVNPTEPGHQDADQKGEATDEQGTQDGPDVGPDANLTEPGHQDANEAGEAASE